ncbi:MAG: YfhO family protein [Clostridia bacterium]|nr:YfhO family protein [Clostridia bacterium]
MHQTRREARAISRTSGEEGGHALAGLLGKYTLVFALFFFVVMSPFWLYGRAFLMGGDGMSQYVSMLSYARYWVRALSENLSRGRWEIPLWSLWVGFGQNTIGTVISYLPFNYFYGLLSADKLAPYLMLRSMLGMYASGLAFLAFGRTRARSTTALLLGSMIYVFSGFIPAYTTRHWHFLSMTIMMPLMLLGVDRVFEGKWSWLFVFSVFKEGLTNFYTLFLITVPAVVYALFHWYELDGEGRARCGGFMRVLFRHVLQYAVGLGLAAVSLIPVLTDAFTSSRTGAAESALSYWHWPLQTYFETLRGILDPLAIWGSGYIGLPGIALMGVFGMLRCGRRRDRVVVGQLALYSLALLIPALTLVFNAFSGRNLRWCYIFTFWAAIATATGLPGLRRDAGRGLRFACCAFFGYVALYTVACVWTGEAITPALVAALVGAAAVVAALSDWGRSRRRWAAVLLFAALLAELTVKAYVLYDPQYGNDIGLSYDAPSLLAQTRDDAADALKMAKDDGLYRVDVVTNGTKYDNYGVRDRVNGVSSYYPYNHSRICGYSMDLGNSAQRNRYRISSLAQRTVLDELAGVKYLAALEDGKNRVPYGYELVKSRKKTLSTGTQTTEYLYKNNYALPLSYAYTSWIPEEDYRALSLNRREQAMLQGVVLEEDTGLDKADLTFDDVVLMDSGALTEALAQAAEGDADLEVSEGTVRVLKANYSVSIPIEPAEGEICLQFRALGFEPLNSDALKAEQALRDGSTRLQHMRLRGRARQWKAPNTAVVSASSGDLSDEVHLLSWYGQYYNGPMDILLNLGYGETGKKLKIKFSEPGEYSFDDIQLIVQPMDGYADKVAPLMERAAKSVQVDGNRVLVEYDLEEKALACLAVAYDEGWSAAVDGEKARVLPANGMYMGVMLEPGKHTVEFNYVLPGFRLGLGISLVTLLGCVIGAVASAVRRKKRRPA